MTAVLSPVAKAQFFDNNGRPLVGGKLFTYIAGTTTKQSTYTDSTGITPNANPVLLDYRGECNLWVPPNVGYKYVLAPSTDTDPPTHPIWSVDSLVSSQLITLYGGVDTGTANAYVLNFTSNFASYTDGIIIYWIPANTNTGASTINVNGIGVVSIINPDGSALFGGQLVANVPAQILYKSGSFQLITPSTSAINSFAPTWSSGFSVAPNSSITYRKTGNFAALSLSGNGTSNGTSFQMSGLPAIIRPNLLQQIVPCLGMTDNGSIITTTGVAQILATGIINFFKDPTLTNNWTNVGTKGFRADGNFITVVYQL